MLSAHQTVQDPVAMNFMGYVSPWQTLAG